MNPALPPLVAHLFAQLPGATLIETHISWVILAGQFAYKIKKPLDLGFLDFSTLEKRQHCCEEEIRLNRRLAPDVYLEALPITGSESHPTLGGEGPVLEWAVKMRAFPQKATLDLEESIADFQVDAIADRIADFHQTVALAPSSTPYGTPEQVHAPIQANFQQLHGLQPPETIKPLLSALEAQAEAEFARLQTHFASRKAAGFIRECHGDLHLGNIAWVKDAPLIFDGIEFNPDLRFIDVMSDMAFLVMDLHHRGEHGLAWRVLNRYLERTGDYSGLAALPYYMSYRAMVRAKVAAIRAKQSGGDFRECEVYLQLAATLAKADFPALILMHGVSGSGKTVLSQHLLEDLGAIRLRSDVERKRLFGLGPLDDSRSIPGGIYKLAAGENTLNLLLSQTRALLLHGFRVVVDATFLARRWREPFQAMAAELRIAWAMVSPQVSRETLLSRVSQRQATGGDASEADTSVLESQLLNQEPLEPAELPHLLAPDSSWTRAALHDRTLSLLTSSGLKATAS